VATDTDRRARILDAAESRFAEDGFDATGTAAIAAEARVPKGLLFYYFPRKVDILRALLDERLPDPPLCRPADVVRHGDPRGSLLRLAQRVGLDRHESVVLRTIVFRELGTHPEVRDHLHRLREGMLELTEAVLDAAVEHVLDPVLRRQAAHTFVAVLLDDANTRRYDGVGPDVDGAARVVSAAVAPTAG
jgi:AcrR family transcriptional regulator